MVWRLAAAVAAAADALQVWTRFHQVVIVRVGVVNAALCRMLCFGDRWYAILWKQGFLLV